MQLVFLFYQTEHLVNLYSRTQQTCYRFRHLFLIVNEKQTEILRKIVDETNENY